jgi:D-alanyl-D-alanine carboxypeptidase
MKAILISAFLLITLTSSFLYGQQFNKIKLDSLLDVLAANNKAMGSLVLSKHGAVVYNKAIGYSTISGDKREPATANTIYRVGSITKMFTATMIFQLIDEGKLSLTTTLDKYYRQFPNAGTITISHILSHRSGLFNYTSDSLFLKSMTQPKTKKEMLAIMAKHPADFPPDEKFAYSNTNYVLLGYIIEQITRK